MKRSWLAGLIVVACLLCVWGWRIHHHQRAVTPQKIVSSIRDATVQQTWTQPAARVASPATLQPSSNAVVRHDPAAPVASTSPDQPVDLVAFSNWVEQFLAGSASANTAQGEALAWKRREAMRELIQSDPARAIELTVPFRWTTCSSHRATLWSFPSVWTRSRSPSRRSLIIGPKVTKQ